MEFLLTATNKSNQARCIVFPNDSTNGASSTTCTPHKDADEARLLQESRSKAAHSGRFKPAYVLCIVPSSEDTMKFEKHCDNPRGRWDELAEKVVDIFKEHEFPIITRCSNFQQGEMKHIFSKKKSISTPMTCLRKR